MTSSSFLQELSGALQRTAACHIRPALRPCLLRGSRAASAQRRRLSAAWQAAPQRTRPNTGVLGSRNA